MTHPQPMGELYLYNQAPYPVTVYRREPIAPPDCRLGPRCLVCQWRRSGLVPPASLRPVNERTS